MSSVDAIKKLYENADAQREYDFVSHPMIDIGAGSVFKIVDIGAADMPIIFIVSSGLTVARSQSVLYVTVSRDAPEWATIVKVDLNSRPVPFYETMVVNVRKTSLPSPGGARRKPIKLVAVREDDVTENLSYEFAERDGGFYFVDKNRQSKIKIAPEMADSIWRTADEYESKFLLTQTGFLAGEIYYGELAAPLENVPKLLEFFEKFGTRKAIRPLRELKTFPVVSYDRNSVVNTSSSSISWNEQTRQIEFKEKRYSLRDKDESWSNDIVGSSTFVLGARDAAVVQKIVELYKATGMLQKAYPKDPYAYKFTVRHDEDRVYALPGNVFFLTEIFRALYKQVGAPMPV